MGFPAPSLNDVATYPPGPAPARPAAPNPSPAAPRSPLDDDFQFEILDDDDEIIDLT